MANDVNNINPHDDQTLNAEWTIDNNNTDAQATHSKPTSQETKD